MNRKRYKHEPLERVPQYWNVYYGDRYMGQAWGLREGEVIADAITKYGIPNEGEAIEVQKTDPTK